MKTINVQNGTTGYNFSIYCREVGIGRLEDSWGADREKMRINTSYSNLALLERRLGHVNELLADYDFVEPIEMITDPKLLEGGPHNSTVNRFYLEMGNLGKYLPAFHGVLGYLRGGKTLELALARASLQVCEAIGYDKELEGLVPFNGSQSFLANIWPGLWADSLTEIIVRYKRPNLDLMFASMWANYMGFTEGSKPRLPWGFATLDRIVVDKTRLHTSWPNVPTYFISCLRCEGTSRDSVLTTSMMAYTLLTEPTRMYVYVYPKDIWEQIPFIGKPEGE